MTKTPQSSPGDRALPEADLWLLLQGEHANNQHQIR